MTLPVSLEPGFERCYGLWRLVGALRDLPGSRSTVLWLSLTSPSSNSWEKRADWSGFSQMFTVTPNQLCWGGARCQGSWGWREAYPGMSTPGSPGVLSERQKNCKQWFGAFFPPTSPQGHSQGGVSKPSGQAFRTAAAGTWFTNYWPIYNLK